MWRRHNADGPRAVAVQRPAALGARCGDGPAVSQVELLEPPAAIDLGRTADELAAPDAEQLLDVACRAHLFPLREVGGELGDVVALPLRDEVVHLVGQGLDRLRVVERLLGEVSQLVAHHRHEGPDDDVAQAPVREDSLLRVARVRDLRVGHGVCRHGVGDRIDGSGLHEGVALVAPRAVQPLHDPRHGVALGSGA